MKYIYTGIIVLGFLLSGCAGEDKVTGPDPEPEPEPNTPNVDFTFTPEQPVIGEEVTFNGEVKEGSSDISSWIWSYGDEQESEAEGQSVSFTYENAGTYDVVLTASDDEAKSVEVEHTITIQESADGEFQASIGWSFDTGNSVPNPNDGSSPAIADDGTIYYVEGFAGADSKVISVTDNGDDASLNWETATGHDMRQAPAIGPNGDIYIGNWNAQFVKLSSNGEILWNGNTVGEVANTTAAVDADGNSYIATKGAGNDGGVLSFAPDGTERWKVSDVAWIHASPALSNDGSVLYIYITNKGYVHSLNTGDGSRNWSHNVGEGEGTSMTVGSDGTVYITTGTGITAITDNGNEATTKWTQSANGANQSGVVIGPEGNLYTGSQDGLISLNPDDGSVNWVYDQISIEESVPAVDSEGNLYVGSSDGKLSILNSAGQLLKEFTLGTSLVNSPVIADDGTVYVESMDDSVIKLNKINVEESNGPAASHWPMKGKNRRNSSH